MATRRAPASRIDPFRPHPWHGLSPGEGAPEVVDAFVEMTPFDRVKYEVDKRTGYVRVDRPQAGASICPTLYGFIPRTYCGERVRKLSSGATRGDGDPMDVCIVSDRSIDRAEIVVASRVVGGLQMVDGGEADDKIVAVLANDGVWGGVRDIADLPRDLVARLEHYFLTYKLVPGKPRAVRIAKVYGAARARRVIRASMADYKERFLGNAGR